MPWDEDRLEFLELTASWYSGPTLWEALSVKEEPRRESGAPLRLMVCNHHSRSEKNRESPIVEGRVLSGCLHLGQRITLLPPPKWMSEQKNVFTLKVASIQIAKKDVNYAIPGDLGITLFISYLCVTNSLSLSLSLSLSWNDNTGRR